MSRAGSAEVIANGPSGSLSQVAGNRSAPTCSSRLGAEEGSQRMDVVTPDAARLWSRPSPLYPYVRAVLETVEPVRRSSGS